MPALTKPNVWVDFDDTATTTLTYALQTDPAPLTVSVPGSSPTLGALEFIVTNQTADPVTVTSITFTLQVGDTAADITPSTASILTQVSDTANWAVTSPGAVTSGPAQYVLGPASGSSVTLDAGASVVVELYQMQTVQSPGTSTIGLKEMVGSTPAFSSVAVTTFPDGFYFNGLAATAVSGSALIPVAQVPDTQTVTLVWNSSVVEPAAYKIFYSSATLGQQTAIPSKTGEWLSPALTSDTVFTLMVTVSMTGGQPLVASMSTSVSVQNPELVATSLTSGTATITGAATIGGTLGAQAITATTLAASGAVTAPNATLSGALSAGSLSTGGGLNVGGQSTLAGTSMSSASVNGPLNVSGGATLTGLSATGGKVSMFGTGTMLTSGTTIPNTVVYAQTDGFAVVQILCPGSGTASSYAYGQIYSHSAGQWFQNQGGNVGQFGSGWSYQMGNNPNSMTIPIPAGTYWQYAGVAGWGGNQEDSPIQIWWFPMGSSSSGDTYRIVTDGSGPPLAEPPEIPQIDAFAVPIDDAGSPEPRNTPATGFGPGTMLASGTTVANTAVHAASDGFAVVQIVPPDSNSASSYAYGYIYTVGKWFQVQGGNAGQFGAGWSYQMNSNPNTMTIPIPAGTSWQYFGAPSNGNQADATIEIWWFPSVPLPSGTAKASRSTAATTPLVDPPAIPDTDALEQAHADHAKTFIERLANVFNISVGDDQKSELAKLYARK